MSKCTAFAWLFALTAAPLTATAETGTIDFCGKTVKLTASSVSCQGRTQPDELRVGLNDLSPLAQLTRLKSLGFRGVVVGDLSPLSDLPNLQYLNIEDGELTNASSLGFFGEI
jgi:Leucine-rich repeat (LRR) protein